MWGVTIDRWFFSYSRFKKVKLPCLRMKEIKDFVEGMNLYYATLLNSVSESVRILSEIQKEFKDHYVKIKKFQTDPTMLLDGLGDLNEDQKDELITTFVRMAKLENKMKNLFDLSSEDQLKLADEIDIIKKRMGGAE